MTTILRPARASKTVRIFLGRMLGYEVTMLSNQHLGRVIFESWAVRLRQELHLWIGYATSHLAERLPERIGSWRRCNTSIWRWWSVVGS